MGFHRKKISDDNNVFGHTAGAAVSSANTALKQGKYSHSVLVKVCAWSSTAVLRVPVEGPRVSQKYSWIN